MKPVDDSDKFTVSFHCSSVSDHQDPLKVFEENSLLINSSNVMASSAWLK